MQGRIIEVAFGKKDQTNLYIRLANKAVYVRKLLQNNSFQEREADLVIEQVRDALDNRKLFPLKGWEKVR